MMIVFDVVEVKVIAEVKVVVEVEVEVEVNVDVATFEITMAHLAEHQCGAL